jgi:hypothetical protein
MRHDPIRTGGSLLGALLTASVMLAQAPEPGEFGTEDESITIVSAASFIANGGSIGASGELRWNAGGGQLRFPIEFLPNGARITRVTYYFRDTDPAENIRLIFCRRWFDADNGAPGDSACSLSGESIGIDGDSYLVDDTARDILYRRDVDGSGSTDIEYYYFLIETPSHTVATSLRAVEVLWQRRVHPAPQAATFNDVPTNHPFFQFVEALADSGITAGCGNGNYCPDAPLTRGQMAVFLAKALGLHWPWNAQ